MRLLRLSLPVLSSRCFALWAIALMCGCQTAQPPREVTTAAKPSKDVAASYQAALEALRQDKPEDAYALVSEGAKAGDTKSMFLSGFLQDIGAGVIIEHGKSLELIEAAAMKGYPVAAGYLAWRDTTGWGSGIPDPVSANRHLSATKDAVEIDEGLSRWLEFKGGMCWPSLNLAADWMVRRAKLGDPAAESNLALAFLGGAWGIGEDMEQHLYWLERASGHGVPGAMVLLSMHLDLGLLGERNPVRALELLGAAAEAGDATAQSLLGDRFREGHGVETDLAKAEDWYRKAADQGDVEAMTKLGNLLRDGGDGLAPNLEVAYRYLRRAADLGDTEAMTSAASMLELGEGVAVNTEEAKLLLEKAAAAGNDVAEDMLGDFAQNYRSDGQPDFVVARGWYEKAAAKGNIHAINSIGILHEMGRGVPEDHAKAFEWYEQAARMGDAWAQNRVGWMLKEGKGIEKDVEEAIAWFKLAAEKGLSDAHRNLAAHYMSDLGRPMYAALAFEELCHYLRSEEDEEAEQFLRVVFATAEPAERDAIWALIELQVADPGLMSAAGGLAETLLEFLKMPGFQRQEWRDQQGAKLLRAMIAADRPASFGVIAWHRYTGHWVPFDLGEARRYLQKGLDAGVPGVPAVEAAIESGCGPDEESRSKARDRLRAAADGGDPFAAKMMLSAWFTSGISEDDRERAHRYYRNSRGLGPGIPDPPPEILDNALQRRRVPNTISDEQFAMLKAAVPVAEERRAAPVFTTQPEYPIELLESRLTGRSLVSFVVSTDGLPVDVEVTESTHPLFAIAAAAAVRHWRFAPALKEGKPVEAKIGVPIVFKLKESGGSHLPGEPDRSPR